MSHDEVKTYATRFFPSIDFFIFISGIILHIVMVWGLVNILFIHPEHDWFIVSLAIALTIGSFFIPIYGYAMGHLKISVSETGLTMHRLDSTVSCRWDEILKFREVYSEFGTWLLVKTKRGEIVIPGHLRDVNELLAFVRKKLKDYAVGAQLHEPREEMVISFWPFRRRKSVPGTKGKG